MAAFNVPIIGDSLSDATRQYSDWQRVNLGTEAANIGRRNEAERYWNSQVAQRDQEAFQRQQIEEQRQLNQEAIGRDLYRWETGRKDVAAYNAETAKLAREKIAADSGLNAAKDARALEEQTNAAENLAQPIAETGARLDAATADWQAKTTALNTAVATLSQQAPGLIKFDSAKGVKMFKPLKQPDDAGDKLAAAAAARANAQAAELINAHVLAEDARDVVLNEFNTHSQKLGNNLTYAKRDGRYSVINLLAKPGENEHRWQPQAIVGPPKPVPSAYSWADLKRSEDTWTPAAPAVSSAPISDVMQPSPTATATMPPPATLSIPTQKAQLANRLAAEHPEWPRQQILLEVNRAFSAPPAAQPPAPAAPPPQWQGAPAPELPPLRRTSYYMPPEDVIEARRDQPWRTAYPMPPEY